METTNLKLARIASAAMVAVGASLFIAYLIYLLIPGLYAKVPAANLGLILYALATAGAAFVTWGLLLGSTTAQGIGRARVMWATGIGIGLLALMRLVVAVFPHAPFDEIRYIPIVESVLFGLVALRFLRG